ncbi:hypothetical protein ACOMHN_020315 [Nucella lapillus]
MAGSTSLLEASQVLEAALKQMDGIIARSTVESPDMDHPEIIHPMMGHPETGHPETGHPETGHPQTDHPQTVHPQTVHPQTVHPQTVHPQTDHLQNHSEVHKDTQNGWHPHQGQPTLKVTTSRVFSLLSDLKSALQGSMEEVKENVSPDLLEFFQAWVFSPDCFLSPVHSNALFSAPTEKEREALSF